MTNSLQDYKHGDSTSTSGLYPNALSLQKFDNSRKRSINPISNYLRRRKRLQSKQPRNLCCQPECVQKIYQKSWRAKQVSKHVETNLFVLHIPGPRNFKALKRCSILKQMGLSCLDSLLSDKTVGPKRGGGNNLIQSTHVVWRTKNSCGSHYTASQNLPGKPLYSAQIQSPWHPTGLFSGANCNPKFKPTFKTIY